jgi:chromosome segregation ATPase
MKVYDLRQALAAQERELEYLRLELARRSGHIDALETQLKVRSRWDEDLRQVAENLDAQLLARDDEIAELRRIEETLREELEWRRETEQSLRETEQYLRQTEEVLQHDVESLHQQIAAIESTRLWRVGQRYWSLKAFVRRAIRRGSP